VCVFLYFVLFFNYAVLLLVGCCIDFLAFLFKFLYKRVGFFYMRFYETIVLLVLASTRLVAKRE
jgi:hypothetical protein